MSLVSSLTRLRLRGQLILTMALAGGFPLAVSAVVAQVVSSNALTDAATSRVDALRSARVAAIESIFVQVSSQASSLAEDEMVVDGATSLISAFATIGEGAKPAELEAARTEVTNFYTGTFGPKLRENADARAVEVKDLVPSARAGLVAQQRFIVNNPHPLGKKHTLDTAGSDTYATVHGRLHPILRSYLDRFGYYDIFVIDVATDTVVYTVFKEIDFASHLDPAKAAGDGLVRAYEKAKTLTPGTVHFEDFAPYVASYDAPAAFASTPIVRNGAVVAVLVFQLPVDRINALVNDEAGLGTTGSSYLVGADGLMRTQSRFTTSPTIFKTKISTDAAVAALKGERGVGRYVGPAGKPVLGAWSPVKLAGLPWALVTEVDENEALASTTTMSWILLAVLIAALAVLTVIAARFASRLSSRVDVAVVHASAVARGEMNGEIVVEGHDEIADMLEALRVMKTELFGRMLAEKNEALRIREALDNAAANIVVAGPDGTIVFANRSVIELLSRHGADFRTSFPRLGSVLVGESLSTLEVTPGERDRTIGKRSFRVVSGPIVGSDGKNVGTVVEWRDLTEEVDAAAQVESLIQATSDGVLDRRLDAQRFQGFMRRIGAGMNQMLDAIVAPLTVTAQSLERLSKGDVPPPINTSYHGAFEKLRNNLNSCSSAVRHLVEDSENLSRAAVAGDLHARADLTRHEGDFRRVMEGVNNTLTALVDPIEETKQVLGMLADGDLTGRVTGNFVGEYEALKDAANRSAENLQALATEIRSVSTVITSASNEIADGNASLSDRTQQEAASLEETWASVRDLTTTVQANSQSARDARRIAQESSAKADEGRTIVASAVEAMQAIERSSSRIDEIIGVIDEIAFQTNLLALNASVEAARAGEQGRGFAVVASEVRNLAQRSATAAREIKTLIAESSSRVADGARLVNASGKTLEGIVGSAHGVAQLIAKISDAGDEQAAGILQLQRSIEDLEASVQQNAALVEEVSAASNSLREQAQHLDQQVAAFKTDDGAGDTAAPAQMRRKRARRSPPRAHAAE
jgi:methyl-accepting chemotaxis protein